MMTAARAAMAITISKDNEDELVSTVALTAKANSMNKLSLASAVNTCSPFTTNIIIVITAKGRYLATSGGRPWRRVNPTIQPTTTDNA